MRYAVCGMRYAVPGSSVVAVAVLVAPPHTDCIYSRYPGLRDGRPTLISNQR